MLKAKINTFCFHHNSYLKQNKFQTHAFMIFVYIYLKSYRIYQNITFPMKGNQNAIQYNVQHNNILVSSDQRPQFNYKSNTQENYQSILLSRQFESLSLYSLSIQNKNIHESSKGNKKMSELAKMSKEELINTIMKSQIKNIICSAKIIYSWLVRRRKQNQKEYHEYFLNQLKNIFANHQRQRTIRELQLKKRNSFKKNEKDCSQLQKKQIKFENQQQQRTYYKKQINNKQSKSTRILQQYGLQNNHTKFKTHPNLLSFQNKQYQFNDYQNKNKEKEKNPQNKFQNSFEARLPQETPTNQLNRDLQKPQKQKNIFVNTQTNDPSNFIKSQQSTKNYYVIPNKQITVKFNNPSNMIMSHPLRQNYIQIPSQQITHNYFPQHEKFKFIKKSISSHQLIVTPSQRPNLMNRPVSNHPNLPQNEIINRQKSQEYRQKSSTRRSKIFVVSKLSKGVSKSLH